MLSITAILATTKSISNSVFSSSKALAYLWQLTVLVYSLNSPIFLGLDSPETFNAQLYLIISSIIIILYYLSITISKIVPKALNANSKSKNWLNIIIIILLGFSLLGIMSLLSMTISETALILAALITPLVLFKETRIEKSNLLFIATEFLLLNILSSLSFLNFGYKYSLAVFLCSLANSILFILPNFLFMLEKQKLDLDFTLKNRQIIIFVAALAPGLYAILANINILKTQYVFATLPLLLYFDFLRDLSQLDQSNLKKLRLKSQALVVLIMICHLCLAFY
jgi:hypothetical protein